MVLRSIAVAIYGCRRRARPLPRRRAGYATAEIDKSDPRPDEPVFLCAPDPPPQPPAADPDDFWGDATLDELLAADDDDPLALGLGRYCADEDDYTADRDPGQAAASDAPPGPTAPPRGRRPPATPPLERRQASRPQTRAAGPSE